jgi:hypothetical protein
MCVQIIQIEVKMYLHYSNRDHNLNLEQFFIDRGLPIRVLAHLELPNRVPREEFDYTFNQWIDRVQSDHRTMVGYIVGYEQPKFSPLHLHALLIAAQPLDVSTVRANWLNLVGPQYQTSIVAADYQPGRGGLAYALKASDEDLCDVRFSNNLALFSRDYEPPDPSRLTARDRRRINRIHSQYAVQESSVLCPPGRNGTRLLNA